MTIKIIQAIENIFAVLGLLVFLFAIISEVQE